MQRRFYLTVRYSPKEKNKKRENLDWKKYVSSLLKTPGEDFSSFIHQQSQEKKLLDRELKFFESQFGSKSNLKRLSFEEFVPIFQSILEVDSSKVILSEYNMQDNFLTYPISCRDEKLVIKDKNTRVYYLEQLPGEYRLGYLKYFIDGIS